MLGASVAWAAWAALLASVMAAVSVMADAMVMAMAAAAGATAPERQSLPERWLEARWPALRTTTAIPMALPRFMATPTNGQRRRHRLLHAAVPVIRPEKRHVSRL